MAGRKEDLETAVAALYREPLPDWTAARNALSARLKGEGRKADAETVRALKKPSLSAWAVNQLFLREPEGMAALFAAGKEARAAQGQAASGRGAEAFREAQREARQQIEALRRRAVALLAEGGSGASPAIAERIGRDLEALAFSPAAAPAAARGWLDVDLDPPGFEVLTGLKLVAPPRPRPASPPPAKRAEPAPKAPSRLLEFKRQSPAESREAAAARKRAEVESARQAREEARRQERIERAQAAVARAEEKATALRATADAADRQAAEARRQAERAERDAATARRHAETAEAELDRARESLAELKG